MLLSAVRGTNVEELNYKNQEVEEFDGYYDEQGESPRLESGISTLPAEVHFFVNWSVV